MKKIIVLLSLILLGCVGGGKKNLEDCHHFLSIYNNSSFTIYAHGDCGYPDTLGFASRFPNPILNGEIYRVAPNSVNTDAVYLYDNCWEVRIKSEVCPSDILTIYLFREDSLKANDWKDAPNYVLKRYDLTIDDLNAIGWTINYP